MIKDATHTMMSDCKYCQGAHRGESDDSLEDAMRELDRKIARCLRLRTGMTTSHYPPVINYNDNQI